MRPAPWATAAWPWTGGLPFFGPVLCLQFGGESMWSISEFHGLKTYQIDMKFNFSDPYNN
jgi:hypothetical protein